MRGWVRWQPEIRAFQMEGMVHGKPFGIFERKDEGQWGWAELWRSSRLRWAGLDVTLLEVVAVGGFQAGGTQDLC